jgi:hypothetical protein
LPKADSVPENNQPPDLQTKNEEAAKGNFNIEAQKPLQTANEKSKANRNLK